MSAFRDNFKMFGREHIRSSALSTGWKNAAALLVAASVIGSSESSHSQTPPPPSPDPHNVGGIWFGTGYYEPATMLFRPMDGSALPYTPAGLALATRRIESDKAGHPLPHGVCDVNGFPLAANGEPFQVIQTPDRIYSVGEANHDVRIVYMNRDHPAHVTPSFRGDSVGHWEDDTLVIDTIGFRSDIWLDSKGTPASPGLHVVERFKKTNEGKVLDAIITFEDPVYYTHPWSIHRRFLWRPAERIGEEICEEAVEPDAGS